MVIIYIIFKRKKKHGRFSAKKNKQRRRENKESLQQVSTLEQNGSAIITDYSTSFFFYVRVNPTLIKRLCCYMLRIMFRHLGFHTESAHPTGSKSNYNFLLLFAAKKTAL